MTRLSELVERRDLTALDARLGELTPPVVAEELTRLRPERRAIPFRLLSKERASRVFEMLDAPVQQELLEALRDDDVRRLFEELDPDDRARLTEEMPASVANRLLAGLSPHERSMTAALLGYPEESAGRMMSPEVLSLRESTRADDALARVRSVGRSAETIYALMVTDDERRLVGALGLRDLVLAPPEATVQDLMDRELISVRADADQEVAARLMLDAGLLALPVTDAENRLLGIITVDDAMEILEQEDTEDAALGGAAEPLGRPYLGVSVMGLARSRVGWLVGLILAAALTVNVLHLFEATLDRVVALALFVPLLIGTGGNTGAQSATTVTRALAVGEIRWADVWHVILREARVGAILGAMLAGLAFVPTWLFVGPRIALVVSLSLLVICALATFVGSLLPLVAKRVGADPAVMSAPLITTIVDASGLLLYFLIAQAVLGI